jgi:iron complex transport system permease protein
MPEVDAVSLAADEIKGLPQADNLRLLWVFGLPAFLALTALWLNLSSGPAELTAGQVWRSLIGSSANPATDLIVWQIRLPRALAALLGGSCLAVSGVLLQVYFRNPVVGPYVLGISSGSTLLVALVSLTSLNFGINALGSHMTTLAALGGALGAMLVVLVIASRVRGGVVLLIIGLMFGYLTAALTSFLSSFAEAANLKSFHLWMLGSLAGYDWDRLTLLALCGGLSLVGALALAKPLNAFLLGEDYAATMGVNVRRNRVIIVFLACILTAVVTATAGPVAFVGLAVPHVARLSLGGSDNRLLIPATMLWGAGLTEVCDLAARMVMSPAEIPLSAVTAVFGAPLVVGLLLKRKSEL